jgi:hypothetical protein
MAEMFFVTKFSLSNQLCLKANAIPERSTVQFSIHENGGQQRQLAVVTAEEAAVLIKMAEAD